MHDPTIVPFAMDVCIDRRCYCVDYTLDPLAPLLASVEGAKKLTSSEK